MLVEGYLSGFSDLCEYEFYTRGVGVEVSARGVSSDFFGFERF